jgi:hypothetical protein
MMSMVTLDAIGANTMLMLTKVSEEVPRLAGWLVYFLPLEAE